MNDPRPPLRPGYNRDPYPEGDMSYPEPVLLETQVVTEWNITLIVSAVLFLMFGAPLSIMLWVLAIRVL